MSSSGVALIAPFAHWRKAMVNKRSVVCIEGYPRSANTFTVAGFIISQGDGGHIARHTHLVGHVKRAVKFKVPTVVVFREPIDAVASLAVFSPYLSLRQCLQFYIDFHEGILSDVSSIVIVPFDEIVKDFSIVIDGLNSKYGDCFIKPECDSGFESKCFKMVEEMDKRYNEADHINDNQVARPNNERNKLSSKYKKELTDSNLYDEKLNQAMNLYSVFLSKFDEQNI